MVLVITLGMGGEGEGGGEGGEGGVGGGGGVGSGGMCGFVYGERGERVNWGGDRFGFRALGGSAMEWVGFIRSRQVGGRHAMSRCAGLNISHSKGEVRIGKIANRALVVSAV